MSDIQTFLGGRVTLHCGDCLDVLAAMPSNSVDAVVTDPPYHLTSIVKRFGGEGAAEAKAGATGAYQRASSGFMGKQWDGGDIAFQPATWAAVLRVLKPGGYLLAFSATRSYHRMGVAIEDAGFEIRDQIGYVFGSGFPKSHSITKAAAERICRCGTASLRERDMRPVRDAGVSEAERAQEKHREILFDGLPEQGPPSAMLWAEREEGGEGREELGMERRRDVSPSPGELRLREVRPLPGTSKIDGEDGRLRDGASQGDGRVGRSTAASSGSGASRGPRAVEQSTLEPGTVAGQPKPQNGGAWPNCGRCGKPIIPDGLGTALKPAWEPICVARKPLDGTHVENILLHGTGALNIDGCRIGTDENTERPTASKSSKGIPGGAFGNYLAAGRPIIGTSGGSELGRWPANLIHDGSDEVLAAFPESDAGAANPSLKRHNGGGIYEGGYTGGQSKVSHGDEGSAARFFYTAKADSEDRLGSKHPTVKPLDLMQYLCRLVTPPGGTILDPFAGTGTTGEAAWREGFRAILIEREAEYQADIALRMDLVLKPAKRAAVAKSKNNLQGAEGTPLFGGEAA